MGKESHLPCARCPFCATVTQGHWERNQWLLESNREGFTFPTHCKGSCNAALERFSCLEQAPCEPAGTWCFRGGIFVRELNTCGLVPGATGRNSGWSWRDRLGEKVTLTFPCREQRPGAYRAREIAQRHLQEAPTMAAAAHPPANQLGCSELGRSWPQLSPRPGETRGETALKKKLSTCTISPPNNTAAIPKWSTITKASSVSKNKEIPVNASIWNAAFFLTLPIELNAVLLTLPFPGKAQCISNWFTLITHFVLGFANSSPSTAQNFSSLLTNGSWLTPINPSRSLPSISIIIPPKPVGETLH